MPTITAPEQCTLTVAQPILTSNPVTIQRHERKAVTVKAPSIPNIPSLSSAPVTDSPEIIPARPLSAFKPTTAANGKSPDVAHYPSQLRAHAPNLDLHIESEVPASTVSSELIPVADDCTPATAQPRTIPFNSMSREPQKPVVITRNTDAQTAASPLLGPSTSFDASFSFAQVLRGEKAKIYSRHASFYASSPTLLASASMSNFRRQSLNLSPVLSPPPISPWHQSSESPYGGARQTQAQGTILTTAQMLRSPTRAALAQTPSKSPWQQSGELSSIGARQTPTPTTILSPEAREDIRKSTLRAFQMHSSRENIEVAHTPNGDILIRPTSTSPNIELLSPTSPFKRSFGVL